MAAPPGFTHLTWTVDELLTEVKDEANIPASSRYGDTEILAFADQAIRSVLSEVVTEGAATTGRWVDYFDILVSEGGNNNSQFWIPPNAFNGIINHVDFYENDSAAVRRLHLTTPAEAYEYDSPNGQGHPTYYYFLDQKVCLVPRPSSASETAFVRIWFPRAHPKLVKTDEADIRGISNIHPDTDPLGLFPVGGNLTSPPWPSSGPFGVDIYSAFSPHAPYVTGLECLNLTGSIKKTPRAEQAFIDLDAVIDDLPTGSVKVAPAGYSDCVQLPPSMRAALTKRTASFLLRAQGDEAGANSLWGVTKDEVATVADALRPRSKAQRRVFINHSSPLRRKGRFRQGWWW